MSVLAGWELWPATDLSILLVEGMYLLAKSISVAGSGDSDPVRGVDRLSGFTSAACSCMSFNKSMQRTKEPAPEAASWRLDISTGPNFGVLGKLLQLQLVLE